MIRSRKPAGRMPERSEDKAGDEAIDGLSRIATQSDIEEDVTILPPRLQTPRKLRIGHL